MKAGGPTGPYARRDSGRRETGIIGHRRHRGPGDATEGLRHRTAPTPSSRHAGPCRPTRLVLTPAGARARETLRTLTPRSHPRPEGRSPITPTTDGSRARALGQGGPSHPPRHGSAIFSQTSRSGAVESPLVWVERMKIGSGPVSLLMAGPQGPTSQGFDAIRIAALHRLRLYKDPKNVRAKEQDRTPDQQTGAEEG